MALELIYSFLTYPKKSQADGAAVSGTEVPMVEGKLYSMLRDIFDKAGTDCNVPVMFTSEGGKQENAVRTDLLALFASPGVKSAAPLATRLQQSTSGSSGMGLLFLCMGTDTNSDQRAVLSRFPADEGVVAEKATSKLTVKFVEQVFLKSSHSYKAATYVFNGKPNQLWSGHVVDKQINHGNKSVADYWIVDFLHSEMHTNAALGTKRLANALKSAIISTSDVEIKGQIAAACQLAKNLPKKAMSIAEFCQSFQLSAAAHSAVVSNVNPPRLIHEKFRFDATEFARHIAYKQKELDNGAVLSAPADKFDECFVITKDKDAHTFTTTGRVVDERLRTTK
jgi:hypothetical protein